MLLEAFLQILKDWEPAFSQKRTANRALRQAIGSLICLGRKTLTRIIWTTGGENRHWSSEYLFHSRSKWSPEELFRPIAKRCLNYCRGSLIGVAADDTTVKKTGTKIQQAFWSRDPMSPPFNVNLRLGIRFLHFAIVLPLYKTAQAASRTVPISFEEVSVVKRPRRNRKDYWQEMQKYRALSKIHNLSTHALEGIARIRQMFDVCGAGKKILVIIGDGALCNRTILSCQTDRTHLLLRVRKDAKLCKRSTVTRRFYDEATFTPQQKSNDDSLAWNKTRLFYGGKKRIVRYKELSQTYWQRGSKRKPLRLFIVAPTSYRTRKTGKLRYREMSFLLTTLEQGHTTDLLQLYFDRWQIEVNHRDLKQNVGVGQAQLHNPIAVPKQPAFVVAAYSALLLASLNAFGPLRGSSYLPLPRWRANATRPSCLDLLTLLRNEIAKNVPFQHEMGIQITFQRMVTFAAA